MFGAAAAVAAVLAFVLVLEVGRWSGTAGSSRPSTGKSLFRQSCASCHTLAAAGSTATIGPNLDAAFRVDREDGFGTKVIERVVLDQIRFATPPMPRNLVRGQDARKVAAFVATRAGVKPPGR